MAALRKPRTPAEPPPPPGPVEVDALDRGEWHITPLHGSGEVEMELRVHGRRFVGVIREHEQAAFEAVLDRVDTDLRSGLSRVDVNAVCQERMGRMPFVERR